MIFDGCNGHSRLCASNSGEAQQALKLLEFEERPGSRASRRSSSRAFDKNRQRVQKGIYMHLLLFIHIYLLIIINVI